MATKTWTLTDLDQNIDEVNWAEEICPGVTARKRQLTGGKRQGVDSLRLESDPFTFEVLPTRGMNIWKVWTGDFEYGWQSPAQGPVHPNFVPLMEPGGLGWLDGFDELFVRCGLESNGAPDFDKDGRLQFPLHGKIANQPARKVNVSVNGDTVQVTGVVREARFHFQKMEMTSTLTWNVGTTRLEISDQIRNLSASDGEVQLLYHINFGVPLLDSRSLFVAPARTVVPRDDHAASAIDAWQNYAAPTPGFEEQVYFLDLAGDASGNTTTVLKNADGTRGVAVEHNTNDLPCFSLWKNTTAVEDGYVTGLEPGTNFPNPRTFEGQHDRTIKIPGKGTHTFEVAVDFLTNEKAVQSAVQAVNKLAPAETMVCDKPQPGWCHGVE